MQTAQGVNYHLPFLNGLQLDTYAPAVVHGRLALRSVGDESYPRGELGKRSYLAQNHVTKMPSAVVADVAVHQSRANNMVTRDTRRLAVS